MDADPLESPEQEISVVVRMDWILAVELTTAVVVWLQPFASVTDTVYTPWLNPTATEVALPEGFHKNWYGAVPPMAIAVALPLVPPLQAAGVVEVVIDTAAGSLMVTGSVDTQPKTSVTVTV